MNLCLFFEGTGQGVTGKITNVTRLRDLCAEDARQVGRGAVDAHARLGDAADALDDLGAAVAVLEGDVEGLLGLGILNLVARDVALFRHNASDLDENLARGHGNPRLVRRVRVPDARQHVGNGIGDFH